jgi:hypothetical protein
MAIVGRHVMITSLLCSSSLTPYLSIIDTAAAGPPALVARYGVAAKCAAPRSTLPLSYSLSATHVVST